MGAILPPRQVTPLVAVLYGYDDEFAVVRDALVDLLGPVSRESAAFAFECTDYYAPEMGAKLYRRFLAFEWISHPDELPSWKVVTNELETCLTERFAETDDDRPARARAVNLDPGYVTAAKLVLASTKDFAHRMYLRLGIFGEITLSFRDGRWQPFPYTFPDFRAETYHAYLNQVRDDHLLKVKDLPAPRT